MTLRIERANGILTVQDLGRPGHLAQGLPRGGAMDRLAVLEAAALLGLTAPVAGVEMAGAGGVFTTTEPTRIALTGAPMRATLDGARVGWHRTIMLLPDQRLSIGGAGAGVYGYLTPAGGVDSPAWLGSRAAHLTIGIGTVLASGTELPLGKDAAPAQAARGIEVADRFSGGTIRLCDGPQSVLFDADCRAAFAATPFRRAHRGNRQGIELEAEARFTSPLAAGLASDVIGPGDVQMIGDGVPYVLLAECQTMGGYPRIGTVLSEDLPTVAQIPPSAPLRFRYLDEAAADAACQSDAALLAAARRRCHDLIRDPAAMTDLLSYSLISGVTRGDELDEDRCK